MGSLAKRLEDRTRVQNNNPKEQGVHMNRMNRRDLLSVLGGASAVSVIGVSAFDSTSADNSPADVTSLHVKELIIMDLGNHELLRIGFPKAPVHKVILTFIPL